MRKILTISLVRHGLTAGNLRGAYIGSMDQPLAPEGRTSLEAIAAAGKYPPVEAVFVSPMQRCVQTAEILYPGFPLQCVDGLQERCFGEFEGKTHEQIIALPGYSGWGMNEESMQFPGGEEKEAFFARCYAAFWQTVDAALAQGLSSIAVVTHGGVIMAIMEQYGLPQKSYFEWHCGNGRGYLLTADAGVRTLSPVCLLDGQNEA